MKKAPPFPMDEQEFRNRADEALTSLNRKLADAEFEADLNAGALTIEFEDSSTRFVVSPNTPVRQIWVSAHSRSYKLDWDAGRNAFVFRDTGETLTELIQGAISKQLGEEVTL